MKPLLSLLVVLSCYGAAQAAPKSPQRDAVQIAALLPTHSLWSRALRVTGQDQTLRGRGPFTVFAPLDTAWQTLSPRVVKALFLPANKALLTGIVRFHILPRKLDGTALAQIKSGTNIRTLEGETILLHTPIIVLDSKRSPTSKIDSFNFFLRNGVMHQIDTLLLPPSLAQRISQLDTAPKP